MKNNKFRLFEIMNKLDASFDVQSNKLDENNPDNASTDVKLISNLKTPSQKNAYNRINHRNELKDAFRAWFSELGVANEYKHRINITTTLSDIRDILNEFGIKS